jgi:hypothetical protein
MRGGRKSAISYVMGENQDAEVATLANTLLVLAS